MDRRHGRPRGDGWVRGGSIGSVEGLERYALSIVECVKASMRAALAVDMLARPSNSIDRPSPALMPLGFCSPRRQQRASLCFGAFACFTHGGRSTPSLLSQHGHRIKAIADGPLVPCITAHKKNSALFNSPPRVALEGDAASAFAAAASGGTDDR